MGDAQSRNRSRNAVLGEVDEEEEVPLLLVVFFGPRVRVVVVVEYLLKG